MRKKTPLRISLIIICVVALSIFAAVTYSFSCKTYSCINFPHQQDWVLQEEYEHSKDVWRGVLSHNDQLLRIEIIRSVSPHEAQMFTQSRLAQILGLYDTGGSPYPGAISQTVRCDDMYKPKVQVVMPVHASVTTAYFTGLLNSRLQYGSCMENQIVYVSSLGIIYCKNEKKWVQLEYISDVAHPLSDAQGKEFMRSVFCRSF